MIFSLAIRMMKEVDFRLLRKFAINMGWKGMTAISKFKKRQKKGKLFPAFLMISVTNTCNFSCQGCWVTIKNDNGGMDPEVLNNIIISSKKQGSYFFGLLGGEPLMYPSLFKVIEKHKDCYFQIFTNGSLLSPDIAEKMRSAGNITPLISVEGLEDVSDIRRGSKGVYSRTMNGIEAATSSKLITGACASICQSNFKQLVNEEFVDNCAKKGIHYLWYYIYRPVGPEPNPELTLSKEQIIELRKFLVNIRLTAPLMIIDTYWDEKGKALCPGVLGMSHHINSIGDIEFCPPIQFAQENVQDGKALSSIIESSFFLENMREEIAKITNGCILLEDPQSLQNILGMLGANDSSQRNTAYHELNNMSIKPGHHMPDSEIPEKSRLYRFAKKKWFFGLGAYG